MVLDIDETLSATNLAWFERLITLHGMPPENLDVHGLISKYHLAQNVPHWQTDAAQEWMKTQRESKTAQEGLPLIPGAVEGVRELSKIIQIIGYLTVRPVGVTEPTIQWLSSHGFPPAPVIAKPNTVPFEKGNEWKGEVLNDLFPHVLGIVDDNPKVALYSGQKYSGTIFLFGASTVPKEIHYAIPCSTWKDVVHEAAARKDDMTRTITKGIPPYV